MQSFLPFHKSFSSVYHIIYQVDSRNMLIGMKTRNIQYLVYFIEHLKNILIRSTTTTIHIPQYSCHKHNHTIFGKLIFRRPIHGMWRFYISRCLSVCVCICACHLHRFSDAPYYVWGVSTYQDMCVCNCRRHLNRAQRGLVRNKKKKSAKNDFNDDKSGRGYPRRWGLLLN